MTMFWHIRNQMASDIPQTQPGAETQSLAAREKAADLSEQLDKLTLVCAAMWELLREKNGLTEDDLAARVAIIDARDGVADGKITHTVQKCAQCGRPVAATHRKCLYCGAQQPITSIFESL